MSFNPANLTELSPVDDAGAYFVYSTGDAIGTVQSTSEYFDAAIGLMRRGDIVRVQANDATKMFRVSSGAPTISVIVLETL